MLCLRKQFPDKMLYQKTCAKKHQLFLVPGWRSQTSFTNSKTLTDASFFSNHSLDLYLPKFKADRNNTDRQTNTHTDIKTYRLNQP